MQEGIADLVPPVALRDRNDRWWSEVKASDDFLDRLFETFFKRLELPNLMRKSDYHLLAEFVPESLIASDVRGVSGCHSRRCPACSPYGRMSRCNTDI